MTSDDTSYRSREFDAVGHSQLITLLLRQLSEAEARTRPSKSNSAAQGKDADARRSLQQASELTEALAGWAIDHICGLSVEGQKMLPLQPLASKSHPDYVEYRRLADAHVRELDGGDAYAAKPSSAEARRLILRNLVFAGAGAFPPWLRSELLEALDALDGGTCMPLLEPAKRVGTEYLKARARLRLVAFVKFRSRAYAISEEKTREFIGDKIGRTEGTLKDWEQRLKESCLGPLEVHRQVTLAINAASYVRRALDLKHTGEPSEQDAYMADLHERRWDTVALDRAVVEWRQAEKLSSD